MCVCVNRWMDGLQHGLLLQRQACALGQAQLLPLSDRKQKHIKMIVMAANTWQGAAKRNLLLVGSHITIKMFEFVFSLCAER